MLREHWNRSTPPQSAASRALTANQIDVGHPGTPSPGYGIDFRLMKINRYQAFGGHLLGSIGVALCSAALVFLVWYPGPLAQASGVVTIFLILLGVDVVVGPCITLIVFDQRKRELKRDLAIVLLLQLGALVYGLHTVYVARPVYSVFSVDRFEVVFANDITEEKLTKVVAPEFKTLPLFGPRTIAARRPETSEERLQIAMTAVSGGDDVAQLPQYYQPFETAKDLVSKRLQPIEKLRQYNKGSDAEIDRLLTWNAKRPGGIGYLPMRVKVQDLTVVVARDTGEVLDTVSLTPW